MARLGPHPRPHPLYRTDYLHHLLGSRCLPDPLDHHAQKILEFPLLDGKIFRCHGKLSPPHTDQIALLLIVSNFDFADFRRSRNITLPIHLLHPRPRPNCDSNRQTTENDDSNLENGDPRHTRALPRPPLPPENCAKNRHTHPNIPYINSNSYDYYF